MVYFLKNTSIPLNVKTQGQMTPRSLTTFRGHYNTYDYQVISLSDQLFSVIVAHTHTVGKQYSPSLLSWGADSQTYIYSNVESSELQCTYRQRHVTAHRQ